MRISRVLWHVSEALANGDIEGASFYNSQKEGGVMDEKIKGIWALCEAWERALVRDDVDDAELFERLAKEELAAINAELAASEPLATCYGPDVAAVIERFPMLEG